MTGQIVESMREAERPTVTPAQQAPWAGLAITAMWIAVLFVGLWGGDIVSGANAASGSAGSTVPVVVVVAPCALVATIVIARRAFGGDGRP